jgi:hypothetical protein
MSRTHTQTHHSTPTERNSMGLLKACSG